MARPTTKEELLKVANEQFEKLWKLIDTMSTEGQNTEFDFDEDFLQKQKETHWIRDRNLRDVLIHLYEWHQLLINWISLNQNGTPTPFLPEPYNWKTYPQMNVGFFEKHQNTPYNESIELLKESHANALMLIDRFTNEELFQKKYFSWTGTSSLGSYCVSATASHYDWAMKKIKQHMKSKKA